jgi:hypothetical protein
MVGQRHRRALAELVLRYALAEREQQRPPRVRDEGITKQLLEPLDQIHVADETDGVAMCRLCRASSPANDAGVVDEWSVQQLGKRTGEHAYHLLCHCDVTVRAGQVWQGGEQTPKNHP